VKSSSPDTDVPKIQMKVSFMAQSPEYQDGLALAMNFFSYWFSDKIVSRRGPGSEPRRSPGTSP